MEYKNVMFTKNKKWPLALIKYTEEYKKHLERIKKINNSLADCIESCPKIYSEESQYQSYMIFLGEDYCVGAIYIGTSFDEKNLELEIHFDEKYIYLPEEIYEITEHLVDSLAYNFPNKERIEVKLYNNVELSNYNNKYIKMVYSEKLTTYMCINKYKNFGIKKILEKQLTKYLEEIRKI